jgi:hypothetical protein
MQQKNRVRWMLGVSDGERAGDCRSTRSGSPRPIGRSRCSGSTGPCRAGVHASDVWRLDAASGDGTVSLKLADNRVSVSVVEWQIPRQGMDSNCHYYGYRQDPSDTPLPVSISLGSPP